MKELIKYVWLVAGLALFSGCASGPSYKEMSHTIPALNAEQGRLYIYRKTTAGAAVQPEVKLNGEKVTTAKPKGFIYVDKPAGDYQISTSTEVKRTLSLALQKGQTRYVRLNIGMGFFVGHVWPELVEPAVGEKEVTKCKYTGGEAKK